MERKLQVKVYSPEGVIFETVCFGISTTNIIGPFDILYEHERFITHIFDTIYILDEKMQQIQEIPMQLAVIHAKDNMVEIYAIISPLLAASDR
jgi:F0F1-type ATP synthase epsilon subunit